MDTTSHQQPIKPGYDPVVQPLPPQPAADQIVAQQYIVTINGDVGALPPTFNIKAIGVTATIQLVCTVLSVLLGVLAILIGCFDSYDGLPIWMAICFFMVAGILGRVAVQKKSRCSIIAYMVLSILSAVGSAIIAMNMVPAIIYEGSYYYYFSPPIHAPVGLRIAVDFALLLVAVIELVVAIVASAFCCKGTCCSPPSPMQVQYSPAVQAGSVVVPQGQPMTIPQGQTIMINPNPPSYEAGPLPEKSATMMPPQAAPVAVVINAGPPTNPPAGQAASQQPSDQTTPAVDPDTIGHEISLDDDGTDQQPLVM